MKIISRLRTYLRNLVILVLLLLLSISLYVYLPVIQAPDDDYLERKGVIKSVIKSNQWQGGGSRFEELKLVSSSGLQVQLLVRQPTHFSKRQPVVLLLGGIETGHNACKLIPNLKNVICASLSYPGHLPGKFKGASFFYHIHDVQQSVKDTPPAVLLAIDYLAAQPYTKQKHIELVGVSLGAFFISVPAALDQRVSRVWLVQGSAEPKKVIKHNFLKRVDSDILAELFSRLIGNALGSHHILPADWVSRISPRKVIFVNAQRDEALPASSVKILHDAAQQPKEIIWTHGVHVTPGRKEIIQQLSDIVIKRIAFGIQQ